ncbi:MAG: type II toxin-antitoxin system VapC family toxin [Burkholderiaceae bacterium]|nr:type II toxin-antitoxin system VapC family toxin [Burkholderiaceae bacterium]
MAALVVDTSALMAVLLQEQDAAVYAEALGAAGQLCMAAPVWLEAAMVATGRSGEAGGRELARFADALGIEIVAADRALVEAAYEGWLRYGKGRHVAGLNYGDCFSYALAKLRQEPLLFKGNDFSLTDIAAGA